jgi:hypothetical protein
MSDEPADNDDDQPRTASKQGRKRRGGLFVTDAELIERLGVPENLARQRLKMLDADPKGWGFPPKSKMWGRRRYWPAVATWFDAMYGLPSRVHSTTQTAPARDTFREGNFRRGEDPFGLKNYNSIFDK